MIVRERGTNDNAQFFDLFKNMDQRGFCQNSSLVAQWLGFQAFTAMAWSSIPGWGTESAQAMPHGQKKRIFLSCKILIRDKKLFTQFLPDNNERVSKCINEKITITIFNVQQLFVEKAMATHSSTLAWRIPGTGGLVGCRLWGRTESDTTEVTQQQQQQQQGFKKSPGDFPHVQWLGL